MRYFKFICILLILTACADKKLETFSFQSNANDLYISMGDQSCYTPCELTVIPNKAMFVTVGHDPELQFHMKADRGERATSGNGDSSNSSSNAGNWVGNDFDIISGSDAKAIIIMLLTSTSTTLAVVTTGVVLEAAQQSMVVYQYDTKAYYIYLSGVYTGYALHQQALTNYAIQNFPQMQQEIFYEDQPHIDALAELSKLSNERLKELLIGANAPLNGTLSFLDALTLEKVKEILNSELSKSEKIASLSEFLWYDKEALSIIYSDDMELFLKQIDDYLKAKRTILTVKR
ncbi:MAG: hypothetical protein LBV04_02980 [Deferribacteraceae bacterium]|jgi:hypothetical protein|nr:hypothetical protein [Deferribacteraceae bacterium]